MVSTNSHPLHISGNYILCLYTPEQMKYVHLENSLKEAGWTWRRAALKQKHSDVVILLVAVYGDRHKYYIRN